MKNYCVCDFRTSVIYDFVVFFNAFDDEAELLNIVNNVFAHDKSVIAMQYLSDQMSLSHDYDSSHVHLFCITMIIH